jgi:tRNA(adenine34) deaminase
LDLITCFLESYKKSKKLHSDEIPSFTQIYDSNNKLVAESFNGVESSLNATSHSELIAIELALSKSNQKYLTDYILITALEPCLQCGGSILRVKIPRVIYFLPAKKGEGISSLSTESIYLLNHFPKIELVENSEIKKDFEDFFKEKR